MELLYNSQFLKHDQNSHPENSRRLSAFTRLPQTEIENGESYLPLVHSRDYISYIKSAYPQKTLVDADTYINEYSYQTACLAAGAAVMASQTSDFALVRPPGHHAHKDHAAGFCIFNNLAIAVQNLVRQGQKVCILDIDGHLGDGTMDFFYREDRVLYVSLHQYPAYPGRGNFDEIGEGKGKGFTVNIPLPPDSAGDIYLDAVSVWLPAAGKFKPDTVAVSAGFDAHHSDPLLNLNLTLSTYYDIGKILSENFKKIFAVLEGGYVPGFLQKNVVNFCRAINGKPMLFDEDNIQSEKPVLAEYNKRKHKLYKSLSPYWKF